MKQNQEYASAQNALPEQGGLSSATADSDVKTVSIASDVRAKRLLLMAQQEGSSSAALRLGDYAFYGYGRERTDLESFSDDELQNDEHETIEGLAIHHGIRCDASGMFPIRGNRWHKVGEDFDLCEAEYQKLTEAEQSKFELVDLVPVKEGVDYQSAMKHYRIAAEQGVAQAAYSLGHM